MAVRVVTAVRREKEGYRGKRGREREGREKEREREGEGEGRRGRESKWGSERKGRV